MGASGADDRNNYGKRKYRKKTPPSSCLDIGHINTLGETDDPVIDNIVVLLRCCFRRRRLVDEPFLQIPGRDIAPEWPQYLGNRGGDADTK